MNLEVKKRSVGLSQTTRGSHDVTAPVVKPTVVDLSGSDNNSEERSNETSENVMKVYSALSGIGSFPFYHFITDPQCFYRTVENLFYVSFLVKDNRARIFIPKLAEETNELYIEAISGEEEEEENVSPDSNQLVMGMSMRAWRRAIEKYKIEKPFLNLSSF